MSMPPSRRPVRPRIRDEEGRLLTLAQGPEAFECLDPRGMESSVLPCSPRGHVLLGLGGVGCDACFSHLFTLLPAALLDAAAPVFWLESPAMLAALYPEQAADKEETLALPAHWHSLRQSAFWVPDTSDQLVTTAARAVSLAVAEGLCFWWHRQNMRFFPAFWATVRGALDAAICVSRHVCTLGPALADAALPGRVGQTAAGQAAPKAPSLLLPGHAGQLLHRELTLAFAQAGFDVRGMEQPAAATSGAGAASETQQWAADPPSLFFSVNMRGLDSQGRHFALLQALGVPVALWFVDNPWHVLSSLRQGWWKEAVLFVTDASFIPALRAAGARRVAHLPLAVSQGMWDPRPHVLSPAIAQAVHKASGVFVGRASFPARDRFFAAARVPQEAQQEAHALMDHMFATAEAQRPDFHWWVRTLRCSLWPGHDVRSAGLGAELCAAAQRARWISAGLPEGLAVFGDAAGWRALLQDGENSTAQAFYDPLDYYTELPGLYAVAPAVINVTSLLLPAGLTQRHFDVWAAGGFLWTDATPGLNIFPAALTRQICLAGPEGLSGALSGALARKRGGNAWREDMIAAWREHLRERHEYGHRVATVLDYMGL